MAHGRGSNFNFLSHWVFNFFFCSLKGLLRDGKGREGDIQRLFISCLFCFSSNLISLL